MENQERKDSERQNRDAAVKPDPETLHTTDPQKNMEGPISSLMHDVGHGLDKKEDESERDTRRDEDQDDRG